MVVEGLSNSPSAKAGTPTMEENFNYKNPSLYDIKACFQGVDENGRMNNQSQNEKYNSLIGNLRESLEVLSFKIQPKVHEYGFLKK